MVDLYKADRTQPSTEMTEAATDFHARMLDAASDLVQQARPPAALEKNLKLYLLKKLRVGQLVLGNIQVNS